MYDAPLFQQTTNDVNEQFLRKLSVYAKGKISRLDYRLALSKPMAIQQAVPLPDTNLYTHRATFSPLPPKLQTQGYFQWEFLEPENNQTAYTTGSYIGRKKVLNLGTGFIVQPQAMRTLDQGKPQFHPMVLLAADLFLDYPIDKEKRNAVTVYTGIFNFNFGPGHLRPLGVMNPANGSLRYDVLRVSGTGNAFTMYGTGKVYYVQTGYKFRDGLLGTWGTLQPYADIFAGDYDSLKTPCLVWNAGMNWLMSGQNARLSLNYQERPVFADNVTMDTATIINNARRGMAVLQMQLFF